ncbi:hypothetical protein RUS48_00100 [Mycoplasmoides gallisepticum]|nr:hypothetical protein RUS48_00100 [Mycoplasmoides gallisepticum]
MINQKLFNQTDDNPIIINEFVAKTTTEKLVTQSISRLPIVLIGSQIN